MELVSIIIPVYNNVNFIVRCLQSVFSQSYAEIECIIVNDCSTDDTLNIIEEVVRPYKEYGKVKIISNEKNRGLSYSRNVGIKNASGHYIYFLDSDDEITDNCIELLVAYALDYKSDCVIGNGLNIGAGNFPVLKNKVECLTTNERIWKSYLQREWYVMAWNKLLLKEFVLNNNLFFAEGYVHEDILWSFKLAFNAHSMAFVNEVTYKYYVAQEGAITSSISPKRIIDRFYAIEKISEFVYQRVGVSKLLCMEVYNLLFDLNRMNDNVYAKKIRKDLKHFMRPLLKHIILSFDLYSYIKLLPLYIPVLVRLLQRK